MEISLATTDSKDLVNVATEIQNKFMELGIKVELKVHDQNSLTQEIIRDRNFDTLLFGMQYDSIPSLYPFWHTFSIDFPGINISGYSNAEVDLSIENLDLEFDQDSRRELYTEIIETINNDSPIVPLYSPLYIYAQLENIIKPEQKNILTSPEERFFGVSTWHTETERILNIFQR